MIVRDIRSTLKTIKNYTKTYKKSTLIFLLNLLESLDSSKHCVVKNALLLLTTNICSHINHRTLTTKSNLVRAALYLNILINNSSKECFAISTINDCSYNTAISSN